MANRSHIYTCDEVPGGKGFHARGLSEFNWDIPIVHKLMVATNPRIVRSAIWEHDIGILGDRAGAFERSIAFLEKVGEGDLGDRKEFDDELAEMKEFLASTPDSKYILLEAGEILDLQEEELGQAVAALHAEIAELGARADRLIAGQEDAWLGELRADWAEKCRPGYWSDVLYYSFNRPDDDAGAGADSAEAGATEQPEPTAKPAKPAGTAAKKPAKKAAKKPAKKPARKAAKKPAKKPARKAAKPGKKPAKKAAKPGKKPAKRPAKKKPAKNARKR